MQKSYNRCFDTTWKRHDLLRVASIGWSDVLAVADVLDDVSARVKGKHD